MWCHIRSCAGDPFSVPRIMRSVALAFPFHMSTRFQYDRLSEPGNIRLICLRPDRESAPLQIELKVVALDSAPEYAALSYVWGPATPSKKIHIGHTTFEVRPNLYHALKTLRARSISTLWADAISINQEDEDERSRQLKLMTFVFRSAKSVLFYLGEWHASESQELRRIFRSVLRQAYSRVAIVDAGFQQDETLTYDDPGWSIFLDMVERLWFTRVWTIQESVVARIGTYVCGNWKIDQHAFFLAIRYLWNSQDFVDSIARARDPTKAMLAMRRCISLSSCQAEMPNATRLSAFTCITVQAVPVLDLMIAFNGAAATDPRDQFNALVGISKEGIEKTLEPNCTDTVDAIFLHLARYYVENGRGMTLLSIASVPDDGRDLPSWVPRWDRPLPNWLLHDAEDGFVFSNLVCASGRSRDTPKLGGPTGNLLIVQGSIFDSVKTQGKIRQEREPDFSSNFNMAIEVVDYLAEILETLQTNDLAPMEEGDLMTSIRVATCDGWREREIVDVGHFLDGLRYLVADMIEYLLSPTGLCRLNFDVTRSLARLRSYGQSVKNLRLIAARLKMNNTPALRIQPHRCRMTKLTRLVERNYLHGRVGCTTKGRICYMPNNSVVGDQIALIKGYEVPMVIRRSGEQYCVVGPCYVHGVMYGEIWQDDAKLGEIRLA